MTMQSGPDLPLDRTIDAWLDLGPTELSDRVVERARAEVHRTRQRTVWRPFWASAATGSRRQLRYLAVAAVALALLGVGLRLATTPPVGTPASPSPEPTIGLIGPASLNPAPGGFRPASAIANGLIDHTATLLRDAWVLVAGGRPSVCSGCDPGTPNTNPMAGARLYNPTTGTFTAPDRDGVAMTTPRANHVAVLLADGRVLVAGGDGANSPVGMHAMSSAEIYDPTTYTFSPTGTMTYPRRQGTATLLADGRVLIAGGNTGAPFDASGSRARPEIFDPATGAFTPTGSPADAGTVRYATLLADGRVFLIVSPTDYPFHAELYDPARGTFAPVGPAQLGDYWIVGAHLHDDRVLLLSGGGSDLDHRLTFVDVFDPRTGSFAPTRQATIDLFAFTATVLVDGRVLIVGVTGRPDAVPQTPFAVIYDPSTDTLTPTGSPPKARQGHTATLLFDGRVLIVGGGPNLDTRPAFDDSEFFVP